MVQSQEKSPNHAQDLDRLIPADDALLRVMENVEPCSEEMVPLAKAANRVLAQDLAALRTQPPFAASAMDGYAVRFEDVASAPVELTVIGEAAAGNPFSKGVGDSQAVRIFTGAPIPNGADAIVIQENTARQGDIVSVLKAPIKGKFIRPAGLDFKEGDVLLQKASILGPAEVALAASMNYPTLPVHKKPRVSLIATGNELVLPGEALGDGQIIATNSFGLAVLFSDLGCEVRDQGIARDTLEALVSRITVAMEEDSDLIVTMGGASVGDHDLVRPALERIGFNLKIAKIAMRPGKPFLFATKEHNGHVTRFAGLAGNSVSSMIAANVFLRPLVTRLRGLPEQKTKPISAVLGRNLPENDDRAEWMRASLSVGAHGEFVATPFETQDSSQLALLAKADCLVYRPVAAPATAAGAPCEIVLLRNKH